MDSLGSIFQHLIWNIPKQTLFTSLSPNLKYSQTNSIYSFAIGTALSEHIYQHTSIFTSSSRNRIVSQSSPTSFVSRNINPARFSDPPVISPRDIFDRNLRGASRRKFIIPGRNSRRTIEVSAALIKPSTFMAHHDPWGQCFGTVIPLLCRKS